MNSAAAANTAPLKKTPLHALHLELGARMVPFAGYEMPVQYASGIIKEHLHTREKAGLFDVSHMGQAQLTGPSHETTAAALEALVPGEILKLGRGRLRYTMLLNEEGGILDDLMVTRPAAEEEEGTLLLVVNAACKDADYAHIAARLPEGVSLETFDDKALLALQGPKAAGVLAQFDPRAATLGFMTAAPLTLNGVPCHVSRSGYTGEDGFELSVPAERAEDIARALLASDDVEPIGLGARDTLRLEAGLCLYGHDIDETTSPAEAGLEWAIGKRRREEGGFPGAARIQRELREGASRRRVGMRPQGRAPAREGCPVQDVDGNAIGTVTSGGFGPSVGAPVAMGYVAASHSAAGTPIQILVRGTPMPAKVSEMPFVPHRYYRKPA
ncbi:MAG: glycine cleavage system aminomethyltransferase GcvT, partial [Alphaproteobacteria bacterium]